MAGGDNPMKHKALISWLSLVTLTLILLSLNVLGFIQLDWWIVFIPLLSPILLLLIATFAATIFNILFVEENNNEDNNDKGEK